MGFFKAQRELLKQAHEIESELPPVADRMAGAQARMNGALASMAAQTEAANMALTVGANGIPAAITVTSVQQTGMINFNAMLSLEAMVMPDGQPPYPATLGLTVNQMQLAYVQPGKTFRGKIDPQNRQSVWLDPMSIH